ncbi:MAG: flagellar biosynthetic protein FliO [Phycisphaerales bacterium]|nr:flagellar biosynthetic protein FliO [Phycisphaerales bacterium]
MGRSNSSWNRPLWAAATAASLLIAGHTLAQGGYGPDAPQAPAAANAQPAPDSTATPTPPAASRESRPLGPAPRPTRQAEASDAPRPASPPGAMRTIGGLAAVLGLIFIIRWGVVRTVRRRGGVMGQFGAGGRAPSGLLEVLGRYPVARGQTLALIRLDRRILLVSQCSSGFSTLAEVTSPDEVASILMKAADDEGASMSRRFQKLLKGMERDPSLVEEVETIEVGVPRARLARPIQRSFAPAERSNSVESVRRRLGALRGSA